MAQQPIYKPIKILSVNQALTPTAWWNYQIEEDVIVSVRADRSPWRMRQIQRAVREMARQLDLEERGHDEDENR